MRKILVIASQPYDYDALQQSIYRDRYRFFFEEVTTDPGKIGEFISYIIDKYQTRGINGVLGTHDNPESYVAAIVAQEFGLIGIDPTVAFTCLHKYYSREAQKKIVPFAVPQFQYLSLDTLKREEITLSYPFFVKPVKASFSILARSIDRFETLEAFLPKARTRLAESVAPFNYLLKKYTTFELDANLLIAEQILDGMQVTVEGFSWNKKAVIMGITDSIMYPGTMSFERFEYPSRLPIAVQQRMADIAIKLIEGIEFDNSVFNIEMFYNSEKDNIHIVEINPRMSYQFADMFEKVDGTNTYSIQLQLSQGEQPAFENRKGSFGVAASFVFRLFEDRKVIRVPTQEEIDKINILFPDCSIVIKVKEGGRLSDVSQDEQSYRYAIINLGGKDWVDLYTRFEELKQHLRFEFKSMS